MSAVSNNQSADFKKKKTFLSFQENVYVTKTIICNQLIYIHLSAVSNFQSGDFKTKISYCQLINFNICALNTLFDQFQFIS